MTHRRDCQQPTPTTQPSRTMPGLTIHRLPRLRRRPNHTDPMTAGEDLTRALLHIARVGVRQSRAADRPIHSPASGPSLPASFTPRKDPHNDAP